MKKHFYKQAALWATASVLLAIWSVRLHAQAPMKEQLTVTVLDSSGARIADSTVVLSRENTEKSAKTDSDGAVHLEGLAPGEWTITVTREGFSRRERPVVILDTLVSVSVTLEVAPTQSRVKVEAIAEPANARSIGFVSLRWNLSGSSCPAIAGKSHRHLSGPHAGTGNFECHRCTGTRSWNYHMG